MPEFQTLQAIVDASRGKIDSQKLAKLTAALEAALDASLDSLPVDDPMIVRRAMVRHLKTRQITAGNLQHMEQVYMGVIRRAAVCGLISAPPEGPWTRAWQSVIGIANDKRSAKSLLRSLAGWATDKDTQPNEIGYSQICLWAETMGIGYADLERVVLTLDEWKKLPATDESDGTSHLDERLRRKAERGTVRVRVP